MKKPFLIFVILIQSVMLLAQDAQSEFLEAKRLFREEQYFLARSAFASLFNDQTFGSYATFYAGLSAYRLGETREATSIWKLILSNDPSWDQSADVHLWLAKSHFELRDYAQAINYCQEYEDRYANNLNDLRDQYIPQASTEELKLLNERFPEDRLVAVQLARKLDRSSAEDVQLLGTLIDKYNLEVGDYADVQNGEVRRESYAIAVMLPFMFDGLASTGRAVNNKVVMDLYQGMLLAKDELDSLGMPLELYPFDTKRSGEVTRQMLQNPSIRESDLILGPLLPGPIEEVRDFSIEHKINMVNPVSSNPEVIAGNDFAFLLKPSYETIASALASQAIQQFESNKRTLVYYSDNARDSLIATLYMEEMKAAGFEILRYGAVDNTSSRTISDSLSNQHEEFMESWDEIDSLREIPGRFIKSRDPDPEIEEELEYVLISKDEETEGDSLIFYEMRFDVVEDSIGHIMISSRDNGVVNNYINAAESRQDSIGLIGYGNWLKFRIIDYDQYERLGVGLAYPEFVNSDRYMYRQLQSKIMQTYGTTPTDFNFLGYESLMYLGYMLHTYGKYFQNGFIEEGFTSGKVMSGYRYGTNRDNQVVPIIGFKGSRLTPLNQSNGSE